jgi:hypothetical protein
MTMNSIHTHTEDLEQQLYSLKLTSDAHQWLVDLFETLQGLDDWYDGDDIPDREKLKVIHNCLVVLSSNPFFLINHSRLHPLINNLILKWCGANDIEEQKDAAQLPKAYMWRAGFYDVVLEVFAIQNGFQAAAMTASRILEMYGESLDSYTKEFTNA